MDYAESFDVSHECINLFTANTSYPVHSKLQVVYYFQTPNDWTKVTASTFEERDRSQHHALRHLVLDSAHAQCWQVTEELQTASSRNSKIHAVLAGWQHHFDEIGRLACSQYKSIDVAPKPTAKIQAKRKYFAFIPPYFVKAATCLTTHTQGDDWSLWLA